MRAVLQRVKSARVLISGSETAAIGSGILALVGFREEDSAEDAGYIASKILGARIFDDDAGVMNRPVAEIAGEVLLVPQFTLYGDLRKGRRPSYAAAMKPDRASRAFADFVALVKGMYPRTQAGVFGAHMEVSLVNDGPVTILLDSERTF